MNTQSVLVVDDDAIFRERLQKAFISRGFTAHAAATGKEASELAKTHTFSAATVDLKLPNESGISIVEDLHKINPQTKILVLTGYGSISTAVEAMKKGASNYLSKPADADQILEALNENTPSQPPKVATPTLSRVEWEHIQRVLSECGGNISKASKILGLHRRSLQRKIAKEPAKS